LGRPFKAFQYFKKSVCALCFIELLQKVGGAWRERVKVFPDGALGQDASILERQLSRGEG